MRLDFEMAPGTRETPSDFASRLSTRAYRDDLRAFCLDFGLNVQSIVDGNEQAVAGLAALARVDADTMLREAFVRAPDERRFVYKGQHLVRHNLMRDRVRICPACLEEDVDRLHVRMSARPHRRSEWIIGSIRTCDRHGMALVELDFEAAPGCSHDTSRALAGALPRLPRLVDEAQRRRPSTFEAYVRDRIEGRSSSPWLDSVALHGVLRLTHVVGAIVVHGPQVSVDALDDRESWECEAEGFLVLDRGEKGIKDFLNGMQTKFLAGSSDWGPKSMFGRLYEWLAHETADAAYDPMRNLMMENVAHTLPVGPGHDMFGRGFGKRRIHSVHSASLESGLHPRRLRKLLAHEGLIDAATEGVSDDRTTFDATLGGAFLDKIADTLTLKQAASYLNVPRPLEQDLLKRGFIRPLIRGGTPSLKDHAFLRSGLDSFLASLLHEADASLSDEPEFVGIRRAAKIACCDSTGIVALLIEGKLKRVGRDPEETGFMSVLVDVDEVRGKVAAPHHGGVTMRELERELSTATAVVTNLVAKGLIRVRMVPNPVMKRIQPVVDAGDVKRFKETYVTLQGLAAERGRHFRRLQTELAEAGVRPVMDPAELRVTLYRRSEIPPL